LRKLAKLIPATAPHCHIRPSGIDNLTDTIVSSAYVQSIHWLFQHSRSLPNVPGRSAAALSLHAVFGHRSAISAKENGNQVTNKLTGDSPIVSGTARSRRRQDRDCGSRLSFR
jgi:hypothetical protein